MGKSIPIQLEHLSFKSIKQAQEHFREILYRIPLKTDLEGKDYTDVRALLSRHPSAHEKIGCGISGLFVAPDGSEYGRCFHLRRLDDTTDNFSFPQCLNGEPPTRTRFSKAARLAVQSDVAAFRERVFNDTEQCFEGFVRCAKTGAWISSADSHIDHAGPLTFSRIARNFVSSRGIDLEKFDAYNHEGLYGCVFSDPAMVDDFRQYHQQVAVLQVVSRESNLQDAWKGRLDLKPRPTQVVD
jgi:hypothetical protein